jgi:hypothetical protein
MRIQTESAASLESLAEYLERCECIVRFLDERTIDVGVAPRSLAQHHSDDEIELEGYLRVWAATNPESRLQRLGPRPAASA